MKNKPLKVDNEGCVFVLVLSQETLNGRERLLKLNQEGFLQVRQFNSSKHLGWAYLRLNIHLVLVFERFLLFLDHTHSNHSPEFREIRADVHLGRIFRKAANRHGHLSQRWKL